MNDLPFVGAADVERSLGVADAIDALDRAWRVPLPEAPDRQHLAVGTGDLLIMPAWGDPGVGVKLVTVAPANAERGLPLINGCYVLFDRGTLAPLAVLDAAALTALRTAAVSGVATRYLAPEGPLHLVVFGAGTQADWHVRAMRAVRDVRKVTIVGRSPERAAGLAERLSDVEVTIGDASSVAEAGLVCCCTTSSEPLFDGRSLAPGTHVNAVGAYKPVNRELDDATMARARVVVEFRGPALAEAGDVVIAIEHGVLQPEDLIELGDVVRGTTVRQDPSDVTVFKSVGNAFEDLVIASAIHARR